MKRLLLKVLLISLILFFGNSICSQATTKASVKILSNRDFIEKGEEVEISYNIVDQKTAAYLVILYFDDTKLDFISGPENLVIDKNQIKIIWYDIERRKWSKTRRARKNKI